MPVGAAIVIAAVAGIPVIIIIIAVIRSCNRSHHPDTRVSPVYRSLVKSGHRDESSFLNYSRTIIATINCTVEIVLSIFITKHKGICSFHFQMLMDPENQDHNNPQEARVEVDNHLDIQGDNPGFNGSDESLPSVARSGESYAEIAEESGTSKPMEQEAERETEDNPRKARKRRPHSQGTNNQSITDAQRNSQGSSDGSQSTNEFRTVEYTTYGTGSCDVQTTDHTSVNNGSGTSTHMEQETERKPIDNTRKLSCENELRKRTSQGSSDGSLSTNGEVDQTIYSTGSCDNQTTDQTSVKRLLVSGPQQQVPPENVQIHNDTEGIRPVHLRKPCICHQDRSLSRPLKPSPLTAGTNSYGN